MLLHTSIGCRRGNVKKTLISLSALSLFMATGCKAQPSLEADPDLLKGGLCLHRGVFAEHPTAPPTFLPAWAVPYPGARLQTKFLQCGADNKPLRASAQYHSDSKFNEVAAHIEADLRRKNIPIIRIFRAAHGIIFELEEVCGNTSIINVSEDNIAGRPLATELSYQVAYCSHL